MKKNFFSVHVQNEHSPTRITNANINYIVLVLPTQTSGCFYDIKQSGTILDYASLICMTCLKLNSNYKDYLEDNRNLKKIAIFLFLIKMGGT